MSPPEQDTRDKSQPAEQPPADDHPIEETRIIIRDDGEVIIENLTERMTEVALELNPDSELACRFEPAEEGE